MFVPSGYSKGHFAAKSITHVFPLICSTFHLSRLFWRELPRMEREATRLLRVPQKYTWKAQQQCVVPEITTWPVPWKAFWSFVSCVELKLNALVSAVIREIHSLKFIKPRTNNDYFELSQYILIPERRSRSIASDPQNNHRSFWLSLSKKTTWLGRGKRVRLKITILLVSLSQTLPTLHM